MLALIVGVLAIAASPPGELRPAVLAVTSAGKFGTGIDSEPIYPAALTHPNLITVGASTPLDAPAAL